MVTLGGGLNIALQAGVGLDVGAGAGAPPPPAPAPLPALATRPAPARRGAGKTFAGDALPSDKFAISSRFEIEIDGSIVATFSECSGLGVTIQTDKVEEGGYNITTRKLPGRADFTNLTLKHGVLHSTDLFDWFRQVVRGEFARKNVSVRVFNQDMSEILSWQFLRAFPVKWTGPSLQVSSNSTALETLELAHDGFVTV